MSDLDATADQLTLLQTHRQTLQGLLVQQAQLGAAYAPPAVASGIAAARAAIGQAKQALRGWGVAVPDEPNDSAPPATASTSGVTPPFPPSVQAGNDAIIANVGAGAQHVVVGKDIAISGMTAAPDDALVLGTRLAALQAALATARPGMDQGVAMMAEFQLRLLAGELSKPADQSPSGSAVVQIGEWLLANAAPLRPALLTLLREPATLRALARADGGALDWAQRQG